MSQATQAAGTAPANTPTNGALGIVYLRGLIKSRRRSSRNQVPGVAHVLALPALDQWTHPGAVEVWSEKSLGEVGAEVSVKCRVSGFPRSYKTKREDEDGYMREVTVATADVTLSAVE